MKAGIPHKETAAPFCAVALASFLAGGCGGSVQPTVVPERPAAVARLWGAERVSEGARVTVGLRDGTSFTGKYAGLETRGDDEYAVAYRRAGEALRGESELPALGPGARVTETSGREKRGAFLAVGMGSLRFRPDGRRDAVRIPFVKVARLSDAGGRTLSGLDLQRLTVAGQLPLGDVVLIDSGKARHKLRAEQVSRLELPRRSAGNPFLIALGAVTGVVLIVLAIGVMSSGGGGGGGGGGQSSCPFVYSFDGERYVLDAEPFSGSTMEVAQRRDWSRLDHLRESRGTYRLKVANELSETEYLDHARLLVVDHPAGTTVAPDLLGRLHVVSARTTSPSSAHDLYGADVRPLVEREDGRGWTGSPLSVDPESVAESRDGVVLEFPRAAGATRARLVVKARGTAWAPEIVRSALALQGRELDAWYRRVAGDPALQAKLDALQRQAVPQVRLWADGRWRLVSYLTAALPTAVPAVQAVPLDLAPVADGVIRLRIDGLPGTWTLDHAALDVEAEPRAETTALAPQAARAGGGRDALAAVREADGTRHVLEPGDTLELRFAAPPPRAGALRSFVLQSAGYYKLHLRGRGEPQTAAFDALLNQPGALGRFAAARAREQLALAIEAAE